MSQSGAPIGDRPRRPPVRIREESLTIALTGALTSASVPMVRLHLLTLVSAWGPRELLIDLSGVHAIDIDGAEPLLEAQLRQQKRGGVLRLIEVSPTVLHFFRSYARFARLLIPPVSEAEKAGGTWASRPIDLRDRRDRGALPSPADGAAYERPEEHHG